MLNSSYKILSNFKTLPVFVIALFILQAMPERLFCALRQNQNESISLKDIKDSIDALRHELNNHETELRMVDERINNQEATLSSLRQMVLDATQVNKDLVKGNSSTIENKLSSFDANNKNLIADIKQLKTHANETSAALQKMAQKIIDMDTMVAMQSQNVESLQSALSSLMQAMQVNIPHKIATTSSESEKAHIIKSGDTLEKIAKAYGTTTKALKEMNNLSSDRIVVGKVLLIP